jgi:adenosylmethionine-8-amino-7-oxononanoate transaminase
MNGKTDQTNAEDENAISAEESAQQTMMKKHPRSQEIVALDRKYLWHPFTQMKEWEREEPLVVAEAKGIKLTDIHGNTYYDSNSSLWVNVHGHRKKELDDAIRQQLEKVSHSTFLGQTNIPAVLLAEKLVNLTPEGLARVFYSDSGSEAVEIALKMAYQYWQQKEGAGPSKQKFISLVNAYHGDTIGSVSVGGMDLFHSIYRPMLFETIQVPSPYCYRCPLDLVREDCGMACLEKVREVMEEHHSEIAAVVMEPLVQGAAGMLTAPQGYLKGMRELCTQFDILLIVDEVATGFGRTGTMFACQKEGVSPDFMTVAKGITGGYLPLAATLTTQEIYHGFHADYEELKAFFHGHSYTGNQLGCAVALANLELYEKENIIAELQGKMETVRTALQRFNELEHVGDIRQCGLMVGIELVLDRKTKEPYPLKERIGARVTTEARKRGMITRPLGNVLVFMPPLASTRKELMAMLDILYESAAAVTGP